MNPTRPTTRSKRMIKAACVALCASASLLLCVETHATQYSKLSIITTAKQRGVWQGFKAWIAQADLKEEWDAAVYLSDDYPSFPAITNGIVAAGVATAEDVSEILAASVDSAIPDALIRRVYSNDMANAQGRVKWHGRRVRESVVTNGETWVKTEYYADGTSFTFEPQVVTPLDSVKAANARLPKPVVTNGIPARLAAARLRQRENASTTNEITVALVAGGEMP